MVEVSYCAQVPQPPLAVWQAGDLSMRVVMVSEEYGICRWIGQVQRAERWVERWKRTVGNLMRTSRDSQGSTARLETTAEPMAVPH